MNFGKKIYDYKDDILKDLKTLLEFKSVSSMKNNECTDALNFILDKGNEFGLITKNIDNIAGHIELGENGKLCGVLSHLDVVPDEKNWTVPPFTLTEKDNRLYGRGIADDKGAALIALYCLKILKDNNIKGVNTLRCIYGTSEEIGMNDMDTYFKKEPIPDISFTPDSEYGICYAEKGILQLKVFMDRNNGKSLNAIRCSNAINIVPSEAQALVYCSEVEADALLNLSKKIDGNFKFNETIDGLVIQSIGKSAHAMEPHKGYNAASSLVHLLGEYFSDEELGDLCTFIKYCIGRETNGVSLGIQMRDFVSGDLTCNLGKISLNDGKAYLTLDIRYPVTMNGAKIFNQIKKVAKNKNLDVEIINHSTPLYLSKENKTIKILSKSYFDVMGCDPDLYSTGGGTYARKLGGNGVAFGPVFKTDNVNIHNADESIDIDNFFKHGEICLQTMYNLYTKSIEG